MEDVFAAYSCKRGEVLVGWDMDLINDWREEVYIVVLENIVEKVCQWHLLQMCSQSQGVEVWVGC